MTNLQMLLFRLKNKIRRTLTLEDLTVPPEGIEALRKLTKTERDYIYQWFTCYAYKLNSEHQRAASLFIRNKFMQETMTEGNKTDHEKPQQKPRPFQTVNADT